MTQYNNILIPFHQTRKNNIVESNLNYIIRPMVGQIKIKRGFIIISNDPTLQANISFRFFELGGKKNYQEYRGAVITNKVLRDLKDDLVDNLATETIKQFYNLSFDKNIEIPYNYLINLLEAREPLKFETNDQYILSDKDYKTNYGYDGKIDIITNFYGIGRTIDDIVKQLKEGYKLKKMTRYIYKYFLCSKGLKFLKSRISGVKNTSVFSEANGGCGHSGDVTYLFTTEKIQDDIEDLTSLIELKKKKKEEKKLIKLILS